MYAKAKRTHYFTTSLHSKAIESMTTWKSHMCSLFGILSHSWTFRQIDRFCYLTCCWSASSQVFDACTADFQSGLAIKTVSCSICCTEHQPMCIIWLRELADQGAETGLTAPVVFLVKTSVTFSTLTSCTRVLSWPLWTFPICFCCKTHIHSH